MTAKYWEWIDDHFGPMGWFTDSEKEVANFTGGFWRPVAKKEQESMRLWLTQFTYEQG